ncbi:MAG: hypothetical protein M3P83_13160, partial [Actinomycetota bacterium]|nr:hypothetical protein [Actinomycetota bacterium]
PLDTVVRLHLAILVLIRCPFSDQSRLPNGETASAAARHIEHHREQFGLKEQPAYNLLQILGWHSSSGHPAARIGSLSVLRGNIQPRLRLAACAVVPAAARPAWACHDSSLSQHGTAGPVPHLAWVIHPEAEGATYGRSRPP